MTASPSALRLKRSPVAARTNQSDDSPASIIPVHGGERPGPLTLPTSVVQQQQQQQQQLTTHKDLDLSQDRDLRKLTAGAGAVCITQAVHPHKIMIVTEGWCKLTGFSPGEVIGRSLEGWNGKAPEREAGARTSVVDRRQDGTLFVRATSVSLAQDGRGNKYLIHDSQEVATRGCDALPDSRSRCSPPSLLDYIRGVSLLVWLVLYAAVLVYTFVIVLPQRAAPAPVPPPTLEMQPSSLFLASAPHAGTMAEWGLSPIFAHFAEAAVAPEEAPQGGSRWGLSSFFAHFEVSMREEGAFYALP